MLQTHLLLKKKMESIKLLQREMLVMLAHSIIADKLRKLVYYNYQWVPVINLQIKLAKIII